MLRWLFYKLFTRPSHRLKSKDFIIVLSKEGVLCEHPRAMPESIRWDEINEVRLVCTIGIESASLLWIVLRGTKNECSVPREAKGWSRLISRIKKLKGFKRDLLRKGLASRRRSKFILWKAGSGSNRSKKPRGPKARGQASSRRLR